MKPLAVMLLLCLFTTTGFSQCADTFEISSLQPASSAGNDGKIILTVKSSRQYTCELLSYTNSEKVKVAEKSGNSAATVTFEKLNNTNFYRIVLRFPEEENPFCQSRILDQILLTGNKGKL